MKFKVGDKVKFVKSTWSHSGRVKVGEIYEINNVDKDSKIPYQTKTNFEWFKEEELALAEYTYEDLKKSPLGTKLIFKDGVELVRESKNWSCGAYFKREIVDLIRLKDNYGDLGKILKIEEPTYQTVYEYKPEILDEVEKRYLRGVIRPYKNDVIYITKFIISDSEQDAIAKITIKMRNLDGYWYIGLPPFKKDTMYKNMKDDKEYTLEELGL